MNPYCKEADLKDTINRELKVLGIMVLVVVSVIVLIFIGLGLLFYNVDQSEISIHEYKMLEHKIKEHDSFKYFVRQKLPIITWAELRDLGNTFRELEKDKIRKALDDG